MRVRAPAPVRILRGDEPRERTVDVGFGTVRLRLLIDLSVRARLRARPLGGADLGHRSKRDARRGNGKCKAHDDLVGLEDKDVNARSPVAIYSFGDTM